MGKNIKLKDGADGDDAADIERGELRDLGDRLGESLVEASLGKELQSCSGREICDSLNLQKRRLQRRNIKASLQPILVVTLEQGGVDIHGALDEDLAVGAATYARYATGTRKTPGRMHQLITATSLVAI